MYRFLLRPLWILSHIVVAALIVAMVNLSMWQLRRLEEKKDLNALVLSRADGTPVPIGAVVDSIDGVSEGDRVEYRAVAGRGIYEADQEFTIPSRTLNGAPGRFVVTPFRLSDGTAVLVLRGFIPQAISDVAPPIDSIEPPQGEVEIAGWLRKSELPGSLQRQDPDLGNNQFARIDIEAINAAVGEQYRPVFLQLARQTPSTQAELLSMLPLPDRTEGPHFSYAMQWAIFTLIAIVGYPLIIRRVARTPRERVGEELRSPAGEPGTGTGTGTDTGTGTGTDTGGPDS